jgi:hypothetical protein
LGLTKFTNQGQKYRSYVLTGYDAASPYLVPGRNFSAYGTSGANWSTIRSDSAQAAVCFWHWVTRNAAHLF